VNDDLRWYRAVVVAALVVTVLITWPLWNVRSQPPLLPALPMPAIAFGSPLIVAAIGALFVPIPGAILVTLLTVAGMAADQTRMQPEFMAFPILLWGATALPDARLIARGFLISLWFYSGFHKLLSQSYLQHMGAGLIPALPLPGWDAMVPALVIGIALWEMGTAICAVVPPWRHYSAWSALALHVGIVVALGLRPEQPNVAVWPWNLALAVSGFALIGPWNGTLLACVRAASVLVKGALLLLAIAPLGFYAGVTDAYFSHHLYTGAVSRATIQCPAGCLPEQDMNSTWSALKTPLPPESRLFRATFASTCRAGDVLKIEDPFPPLWDRAQGLQIISCPTARLPAAHP
jgi:hypothetical protein